jgi:hypothetical protein
MESENPDPGRPKLSPRKRKNEEISYFKNLNVLWNGLREEKNFSCKFYKNVVIEILVWIRIRVQLNTGTWIRIRVQLIRTCNTAPNYGTCTLLTVMRIQINRIQPRSRLLKVPNKGSLATKEAS